MKKTFLFLLFFTGLWCFGQTLLVKDSITQNPITEVKIFDSTDKLIGMTDYSGKIKLKDSYQNFLVLMNHDYQTKKLGLKNQTLLQDTTVYLTPSVFKLNDAIFKGFKWKSKKENTPVNVLSFTEKDIKFNQPQTTADALSNTGEVYIQKSQLGGGSPMMRGFATNRVLIVVDGIRMNNAIFRSGNLQNVIGVDPFTIARADVIMGPGSVLYGSDAIGGVMNFTTEKVETSSDFQTHGKMIGRYSSASQEKTIHTDLSISSPKWTSYSSFSYSDFQDLRMGENGPDEYLRNEYVKTINQTDYIVENQNPLIQKESGYQQKNFLQKIRFSPNTQLDLGYLFSYAKTSNIPRYDRLTRKSNGVLRSAEWYYGPQMWIQNAISLDLKKKTNWFDEYSSILSHQYFAESRHDRNLNATSKNNRFERVNVWNWDNAFYKKFNSKHKLFYGMDLNLNHINSTANKENITTQEKSKISSRYPNHSNWNQIGVYAKEVWSISPKINIESGLRYSYVQSKSKFSKVFFDFPFDNANFETGALSGNFGSTFRLKKGYKLNANFATGFRAPNIDDIGKIFDSEPGNVVVPNADLKPEYIYSIEGGISKSFGNKLLININGYYSWLNGALVRRDYTLNGQNYIMYEGELSRVQAMQNASRAKVYGGLFSMELNLLNHIKFLGNINYTHGEEELEDGSTTPLRHAAPLFGRMALLYEKKNVKLSLESIFNAKIKATDLPPSEKSKSYMYALDQNGNPYVPSFLVYHFKSQFLIKDYLTLNIGVENILDKRYRGYSSGISAPGRNFVISVQTSF